MTTAHETQHIKGVENEAEAQCFGLQAIDGLADQLEISSEQGRMLALFAARAIEVPPAYRSKECRNGGELDENPTSDTWP